MTIYQSGDVLSVSTAKGQQYHVVVVSGKRFNEAMKAYWVMPVSTSIAKGSIKVGTRWVTASQIYTIPTNRDFSHVGSLSNDELFRVRSLIRETIIEN